MKTSHDTLVILVENLTHRVRSLEEAHLAVVDKLMGPNSSEASVAVTTQEVLAQAIHREWRDAMLGQGRHVSDERLEWDTLPWQDRALDRTIARKLLDTFSFGINVANAD